MHCHRSQSFGCARVAALLDRSLPKKRWDVGEQATTVTSAMMMLMLLLMQP